MYISLHAQFVHHSSLRKQYVAMSSMARLRHTNIFGGNGHLSRKVGWNQWDIGNEWRSFASNLEAELIELDLDSIHECALLRFDSVGLRPLRCVGAVEAFVYFERG